jgi:peptidoglycan/LPS O-acetylase OafA/YrhL
MEVEERKHIPQLDGLRGIAILLVLLIHFFNFGSLYPFFSFGWAGVDLFFVLSGFLITGILLDTKHKRGYYRVFITRRALRVLPLYYAVVIVFAFIAPHFSTTKWFQQYQLYIWLHGTNYLILQKGFFPPLGHFWSLAIEEQFYLVWPAFVLFLNRKWLVVVSLLLIGLGIGIRFQSNNPQIVYGNPLAHLDGLLFGAILSVLIRTNKNWLFNKSNLFLLLSAGLLTIYTIAYLVIYGVGRYDPFMTLPFTITLVSAFFGFFLIYTLKSKEVAGLLSNKVLLFFGKYSYGMYVFNSILHHFSNWAGNDKLPGNQRLIVFSVMCILTVFMSYCSYHLFEKHFLKLKPQ